MIYLKSNNISNDYKLHIYGDYIIVWFREMIIFVYYIEITIILSIATEPPCMSSLHTSDADEKQPWILFHGCFFTFSTLFLFYIPS